MLLYPGTFFAAIPGKISSLRSASYVSAFCGVVHPCQILPTMCSFFISYLPFSHPCPGCWSRSIFGRGGRALGHCSQQVKNILLFNHINRMATPRLPRNVPECTGLPKLCYSNVIQKRPFAALRWGSVSSTQSSVASKSLISFTLKLRTFPA